LKSSGLGIIRSSLYEFDAAPQVHLAIAQKDHENSPIKSFHSHFTAVFDVYHSHFQNFQHFLASARPHGKLQQTQRCRPQATEEIARQGPGFLIAW
jgi:hypothetical protein